MWIAHKNDPMRWFKINQLTNEQFYKGWSAHKGRTVLTFFYLTNNTNSTEIILINDKNGQEKGKLIEPVLYFASKLSWSTV